jgi:hypothetical protein
MAAIPRRPRAAQFVSSALCLLAAACLLVAACSLVRPEEGGADQQSEAARLVR